MKERKSSDRRTTDRRLQALSFDVERRVEQRRSGIDRRALLASQNC